MRSPTYLLGRLRWWLERMSIGSLCRWHVTCLLGGARSRRVPVRSPALGNRRVMLRTGTSDLGTLLSTVQGWHLPDYPIRLDAVILDLGCNVGLTLIDFATRYPGARVVGVEMDEDNYRLALANTRHLARVEVIHGAIATHDGTVSYDASKDTDSFSITHSPSSGAKQRSVPAFTLPTLRARLRLEQIDFIKVDIEGAERQVLAEQLLPGSLDGVDQIAVEIHGPCTDVVRSALEASGFLVERNRRRPGSITAIRW